MLGLTTLTIFFTMAYSQVVDLFDVMPFKYKGIHKPGDNKNV